MQAISVLAFVVAILALFAGLTLAIGTSKSQRGQGVMFFLASLCAAIWVVAIGIFISLPNNAESNAIAPIVVGVIYSAAIPMMIFMMAFLASRMTVGKISIIVFLIFGVVLLTLLWTNPSLLYSAIELGAEGGNRVVLRGDWYYWAYACFFVAIASITLGLVLYRIIRSESHNERAGLTVMMGGFFIAMIFCITGDIWLPMTRYDLIWWGPVSLCAIIVAYFYAALKYHTIVLSAKGLRFVSYLIITSFIAVVYMFIYILAANQIFHIEVSTSILVMNLVMILLLVAVVPLFAELSTIIRSLLSAESVDAKKVFRKYNKLIVQDPPLRDLATFLADNLNFDYIGIVVNGQIYGSRVLYAPDEIADKLPLLASNEDEIWLNINSIEGLATAFADRDLKIVAPLKNGRGQTFGYLLVGKPLGKEELEKEDLATLEVTLNLIGTGVDSKLHLRVANGK